MGLKCFPTLPLISENMIRASIVYPYLLFVSAFFLLATLIIYAALPDLRNTTGISVMCFVTSMGVYYVGLGIVQIMYKLPKAVCVSLRKQRYFKLAKLLHQLIRNGSFGIAVLVHFACLATFCWLNILCFDYWWILRYRIQICITIN